MQIVEIPSEEGFDLRDGAEARTPGVHLSQVLAFMAVKAGILKQDDTYLNELIEETETDKCGEDGRLVRIAMGLAWEQWLVKQKRYKNVIYHPGEFEKDGVIGSPDGLVMMPGKNWVEEYKTTKKSALRSIETAWLWWEQLRGYCVLTKMREAVLRVLFVNGDYRGNVMVFRSYKAAFSEEELEVSWNRIKIYKDQVEPEKGRVAA